MNLLVDVEPRAGITVRFASPRNIGRDKNEKQLQLKLGNPGKDRKVPNDPSLPQ
jgi:hypothetical protein